MSKVTQLNNSGPGTPAQNDYRSVHCDKGHVNSHTE